MSIQQSAVLVDFSSGIGSSFRVTDEAATKEVCAKKKAAAGRAEVKKHLLPDNALDPLQEAIAAARKFHDSKTLPWSKLGEILRVDLWDEYTTGMRSARRRIEEEKAKFLARWEQFCAEAPAALGDLYDPSDFPDKDKVARKIYHEVTFFPVPSGNDFRVDLPEDAKSALRAQVDAEVRATLLAPFKEPLQNMVERLKDPEAVFRNTLVTNLQRLITLMPPGDPEVDKLAHELQDVVKYEPDTLRESKSIRAATAEKAQAILEKMAALAPTISDPTAPTMEQLIAAPALAPEPEPEPANIIDLGLPMRAEDPNRDTPIPAAFPVAADMAVNEALLLPRFAPDFSLAPTESEVPAGFLL